MVMLPYHFPPFTCTSDSFFISKAKLPCLLLQIFLTCYVQDGLSMFLFIVCGIPDSIPKFCFSHSVYDHFLSELFWFFWLCSSTLLMPTDIFQRAWTLGMSQMSNLQLKVPLNWRASVLEKSVDRRHLVLLQSHDWHWLKKSYWKEENGLIFLERMMVFFGCVAQFKFTVPRSFFFGSCCSLHFKYDFPSLSIPLCSSLTA